MRRCLVVSTLLLCALLLEACGDGSEHHVSSPSASAHARAVVYRTPPRPAVPGEAKADAYGASDMRLLTAPLDAFGFDVLSREALANESGTIIVSPVSIADALTMTLNGAAGETAEQMRGVLHLDGLSLRQVDQGWADLIATTQRNSDAEVRIANSLWLRHDIALKPGFLSTNHDFFAADAEGLPDNPAAGAAKINDWVDERTGGRITDLVGPVDPSTVLVLVNTTYVKAGWDDFDKRDTRDGVFRLADRQEVHVPMMHGQFGGDVVETPDYLAVPLEANGSVRVTIVLPRSGRSPETVLPKLANGGWATIGRGSGSHPYIVDLALPRFHAEFSDDAMETTLVELGLPRAFSADAQFPGIASTPLSIGEVVHKATLDLNEQGVEAAAGTAVEMVGAAPPTKHLSVTVDHPFIVVVGDGESDAPLFMAVVRDPR